MKKLSKLFILTIALQFWACEEITDDLNENPNNPTDASASLLLTSIEVADIAVQSGHPARVAGIWSGYLHGANRQHSAINSYIIDGDSFDQTWLKIYANIVGNANLIVEKLDGANNNLVIGIAKAIKAHALGTTTALFGDIPYSEIDIVGEFPNPGFDSQQDVYAAIQTLLDEAIIEFETGIGSIGAADIYFEGDASKWIEVAYTLKARYYLESRNYEAAYEAALQGISTMENALMAPHGTSAGQNENLYHQFLAGGRAGDIDAEGTYITQILDSSQPDYRGNVKTVEEARFNYYFMYEEDLITPNTTGTNDAGGVFAMDASFPLVSYQENLLILAEAGLRSGGFATGLSDLNAFRAFMNDGGYLKPAETDTTYNLLYEAYSADDFEPGGMLNDGSLSSDEALLQEILMERYITFFGQILGFNDIRRTRSETASIQPPPNAGSELPERFIYSQAELNSNTSAPEIAPGVFVKTPINEL